MLRARTLTPTIRRSSICIALVAAVHLGTPTSAQSCSADWADPVVCDVRVGVVAPGAPVQEVTGARPIQIPATKAVRIEVQASDQLGYAFPQDRLLPQLEVDRGCGELIELEDEGQGRFAISAGNRRGTCRMFLWIPGNLNLEWPLDVEVVSPVADGYSRPQAELLASRLYRAILGRSPEAAGLQSTTTEILRGRLEEAITGMFQSREFLTQRLNRPPMEQLEDLYRELLGRDIDAEGIRSHLSNMEQRRYADVALKIVTSEEFEQQLLSANDRNP